MAVKSGASCPTLTLGGGGGAGAWAWSTAVASRATASAMGSTFSSVGGCSSDDSLHVWGSRSNGWKMSHVTLLYYTVPGHKSDKFSEDALRGIATAHHPRHKSAAHTSGRKRSLALSNSAPDCAEVGSYKYVHTDMDKLYVEVFMRVVELTRRWRKFGIGPCGWTTEAPDDGLACDLLRDLHRVFVLN